VLSTLLAEPYLGTDAAHQGLILHSVYHRPNGWDKIPAGRRVPCGESSMWGDYHAREAALLVQRVAKESPSCDSTCEDAMIIADLNEIPAARTRQGGERRTWSGARRPSRRSSSPWDT